MLLCRSCMSWTGRSSIRRRRRTARRRRQHPPRSRLMARHPAPGLRRRGCYAGGPAEQGLGPGQGRLTGDAGGDDDAAADGDGPDGCQTERQHHHHCSRGKDSSSGGGGAPSSVINRRQTVAPAGSELEWAGMALAEARVALAEARRRADLEAQRADAAARQADAEAPLMKTELMQLRGLLNMRGVIEAVERKARAACWSQPDPFQMLHPMEHDKPPRGELWQWMLQQPKYATLRRGLGELGWQQGEVTGRIGELHRVLSSQPHGHYQLSPVAVEIVEGVVSEEQAKALACLCTHLRVRWVFVRRVSWGIGDGSDPYASDDDDDEEEEDERIRASQTSEAP
ncbi:hypothetical protein ABPG75_004832 [Micractinium tetrahymenae]